MLSRLLDNNVLLEHEKAPRYCSVLIAVIGLASLAMLIVQFYQTNNYQPQSAKTTVTQPVKHHYKSQTITGLNLFGQLAANNEQQLGKLNLPQTRLQLILRGAFTSSEPKQGSAIIEIPGQKTHAFRVNSTVYGDAKLHAVYQDRVVLSSNGQLETLYFPAPESPVNNTQAKALPEISPELIDLVKNNATLREVQESVSQLTSPTITAEQRQQLIRQRLQQLRDRARARQKQ